MARIRFILAGAVLGLTWAAALRGYMMQLAGPASTFTFGGTFGIILPSGALAGALLGWAEYQRRAGRQYLVFIGAPLLLAVLPSLLTGGFDPAPAGLALAAMVGGYAVSGRGPRWVRSGAGLITAGATVAPFAAPKPYYLSVTTPTARGPPRWPHRCSWRSPWPAPYPCGRPIPSIHQANPGWPLPGCWLACLPPRLPPSVAAGVLPHCCSQMRT